MMSMITPPVGLKLYVIAEQLPDVNMHRIFAGVLPFAGALLTMIVLLALLF